MNNVKQLCSKYNVVNQETKWNGLNVLHNQASTVAALDIGIPQYQKGQMKDAKVVYILGHDDFREDDIPEDAKVIYQGCVGDEGVYYADLILPGAGYTEKNGIYVNMEGRVQRGRNAITHPGQSREDW